MCRCIQSADALLSKRYQKYFLIIGWKVLKWRVNDATFGPSVSAEDLVTVSGDRAVRA